MRDQNSCTHTEFRDVWTSDNDWDDPDAGHYERVEYSTEDDLDLHRTKCTQCGKIGYYSGAARAYYEQGERSPGIKGLE